MPFDWWTFAFQFVNVIILGWILARFLFRPVAGIIAERRAAAGDALRKAEALKAQSQAALDKLEAERDAIAQKRMAMLEEARAQAESQKKDLVAQAQAQAATIVAHAGEDAKRQEAEARLAVLDDARRLSVEITGRLLANLPNDARFAGYARRLEAALSNLDAQRRAALMNEPDALELVAARPLSAAETRQARKAAAALTGDEMAIPIRTDPSLLAGLDLASPHGTVHNSLRFDLDRIARALDDELRGQ
ncbi:hypothetical protein CSC94_10525 [Zhengella mangrovi]|uniref:ATP synthase subunit b n=1 Tax=Zhengella mangrovi TaxID=1982044 RepID=A0A2G1QN79_9HYPH|nr:F0F1 ATP synthase subunit delta [Zhengella mangrovi]PHP66985.1 hypothetical protein CSC94_10525 [Zhengella mangrovi]